MRIERAPKPGSTLIIANNTCRFAGCKLVSAWVTWTLRIFKEGAGIQKASREDGGNVSVKYPGDTDHKSLCCYLNLTLFLRTGDPRTVYSSIALW